MLPGVINVNMTLPSEQDLAALFQRCSGDPASHGWRVRMRHWFGYYATQAWYEAVVDRLVTENSKWIDVGGGKSVFPYNVKLSEELAGRCELLVGVDPSDNINENTVVHQRVQSTIEDFHSEHLFDVATLRMVAEHIESPEPAVESLARLIKPGGHVVIITPHRWSPVSMVASLTPNRWHSFFTHLLWKTKDEDVFPTCYKMNTRKRLQKLFGDHGFQEVGFRHLANCATFHRFRLTCFGELCLWRCLRSLGLHYPENDLLGVYQRVEDAAI